MDRGEGNAFSHLPNEIVRDAVEFHGAYILELDNDLDTLAEMEGSWGEFARELRARATQGIEWGGFDEDEERDEEDEERDEEDEERRRNGNFCDSFFDDNSKLDLLTAVAPRLYGDIQFDALYGTEEKALALMGTRFASIKWRGQDPEASATPELVNFIRRQLRSNYLTELEVDEVKFKDGEFDKELVAFVKRPWFKWLCFDDAWCRVPFEFIESAHKAWETPKFCEIRDRELFAQISKETLPKIEEYFEKKFEFEGKTSELIIYRPEESDAEFKLKIRKSGFDNDYRISMHYSDF